MIEKMKMVYIVSSVSKKQKMLEDLRALGLLHLADKKSADRTVTERFASLSRTQTALADYADKKKDKKKNGPDVPILSDEEFEKLYESVLADLDRKTALLQAQGAAHAEIERIQAWGNFSPAELKKLNNEGYDFHFYRMGKKEFALAAADENIRLIRLSPVDKMDTVAVLGKLPPEITATEFSVPDKSIDELKAEIAECDKGIQECDEALKKASVYTDSFQVQMLKTQNEEIFSSANATAENDDAFVWISGYIPEANIDKFKTAAAANQWAWAIDDVDDEDDQVPTKLRYNKVSKLIRPLFVILGITPGYREQDISIYFFLFFTLFFAMIIGDAGYGCLFLIAAIVMRVKFGKKKFATGSFLLLVLSIATIVWGAMTGTWFGLEEAMHVPFLKAMVIPGFANYPQYFGITSVAQQNNIIKFSFTIGAIQMALGSILAIRKKISEKNLSWVADLGWVICIISMYLLALLLVVGDNIPMMPVFVGVGISFVLVIIFGGMAPGKTFGQGLKAGVGGAFTAFLDTISCFGNVMSYIRLFAVGMAGLAISQSFNGIGSGFEGVLIVLGIFVIIIGHSLNIIMCLLSVIVHGVRLNVLEFSGQVGLEWTGIVYEPFKKNKQLKK